MNEDYELQTLLDFNGYTYFIESGRYWVKFEVHRIDPTKYVPHGISYSITLHDAYNTRIVGYDNAHHYLPKRKRHKAKKITWDHIHKREVVSSYEFDTASQLLEDFWNTVNDFLERR
jgi:hypothetical protein